MPVRVGEGYAARLIEPCDLLSREIPANRTEILAKLFFIPCADDYGRHSRTLEKPIQRDLRNRLPRFRGNCIDRIDNPEQIFIRHLWPRVTRDFSLQTRNCRRRCTPSKFAGKSPPPKRTPDDCADLLIDSQRHQLPFVIAPDQ